MWLVSSLCRSHRLRELMEAAPEVKIRVRLHEGDPHRERYLALDWPDAWDHYEGPRASVVEALNDAFERWPCERFYGFLSDDIVPRTLDWSRVLEEEAGLERIAYPDDGVHGRGLCTHPCIGGDLVRVWGFWAAPAFRHNFIDNVWYALGEGMGVLKYVPGVRYEHRHPIAEPGLWDAVYALGRESFEADRLLWERVQESGELKYIVETCKVRMWGKGKGGQYG